MTRYFVAGGSGFIGSHVTRRLLDNPDSHVVVFDNLTSGEVWYLDDVRQDKRLTFVEHDLRDLDAVVEHVAGCDLAFHFAANPDIAKAMTDPQVDFWDGTYLTQNLVEACRIQGVDRIVFASGSGVYGDRGEEPVKESVGQLEPVSTYGASKLACEALLSAYCHMFDMHAVCFRFANVVGPRQTHGVAYDFARRLLEEPTELTILGDGEQSKSYLHVSDAVDSMLMLANRGWSDFDVFNVGTDDYVCVRDIADMVVTALELPDVQYAFTGGSRGWKGDVPVVRFDTSKIRRLGWSNSYSSRQALADAIHATIAEARRERAAS